MTFEAVDVDDGDEDEGAPDELKRVAVEQFADDAHPVELVAVEGAGEEHARAGLRGAHDVNGQGDGFAEIGFVEGQLKLARFSERDVLPGDHEGLAFIERPVFQGHPAVQAISGTHPLFFSLSLRLRGRFRRLCGGIILRSSRRSP